MGKPEPKITNEEWLAELERLGLFGKGRNDEGRTVAEWAAELNFSVGKTRDIIREGVGRGVIVMGQRAANSFNGRSFVQAVYRLAKKK